MFIHGLYREKSVVRANPLHMQLLFRLEALRTACQMVGKVVPASSNTQAYV